ncbi:hypothetical protein FIBSPDRAFT_598248 [Athelia psychrophila]|uniref:Uncharacterized protein n=1 Tax=Athelia psychrophila TaxID=1759441 RepID=A0A166GYR8_9AGAM|nr:hypothetical protein FIBSPDRAFT_598248 [Fibularhizoctonia sp. CBS 109695]
MPATAQHVGRSAPLLSNCLIFLLQFASLIILPSSSQNFHLLQPPNPPQNTKCLVLVDASTVVASAIKRLTAPRLARLPATTAALRVTFPVTAPWRPSPSPVTSAARKATYRVSAPRTQPPVEVELFPPPSPAEEEVPRQAPSATAAERLATSLVPAPTQLAAEVVVVDSPEAPLAVEPLQRLATPVVVWAICPATVFREPSAITAPVSATSARTAQRHKSAPATPVARKGEHRAISLLNHRS